MIDDCRNSIHVVEARVLTAEQKCRYKLTTTVMLNIDSTCEAHASKSDLSGSITCTLTNYT